MLTDKKEEHGISKEEHDLIPKNIRTEILDYLSVIGTVFLICGPILAPFYLLGYQIYTYLKTGTCISFTIIELAAFIDIEWAICPNDWIGIWNILNSTPLLVLLLFISLIAVFISTKVISD